MQLYENVMGTDWCKVKLNVYVNTLSKKVINALSMLLAVKHLVFLCPVNRK